ncbi:serine/threonine protein phosphatase [Candidatus Bathyarchaeota archaeon]|nr:MAG: serine/threonine protein phosphatase [Candidatus Bathyarchaeota archaeon]
MEKSANLVKEAKTATSSMLIKLVDEVSQRLEEERKIGSLTNYDVEGGLVNLKVKGNLVVVGDIHGDLESLVYILDNCGFLRKVASEKDFMLLFLGDYGDRGEHSPEVYYIVLWLKTSFPDNVVLLRGNHEGPQDLLAIPHDLPYQFRKKFGADWEKVYQAFINFFDKLPQAAILKPKFLFLHGGIPSKAESLKDLAYADKYHPAKSFLEEILWNDPEERLKGTYPSPRGAGNLFGEDVTRVFLEKIGVKILIRGHEPCDEGIKVNHTGKVLTVFSRKGEPYFNSQAAYLNIDTKKDVSNAYELVSSVVVF